MGIVAMRVFIYSLLPVIAAAAVHVGLDKSIRSPARTRNLRSQLPEKPPSALHHRKRVEPARDDAATGDADEHFEAQADARIPPATTLLPSREGKM
jgi:hypothetical protein